MGNNKEESNIAIVTLEKLPSYGLKRNISHNDGSNNIFVDCIYS